MNLRFVEAFYWAVSLKSVTRAAEKLFITQSAMSSRIAALEDELGVLLLDRRDRQFRLTAAGLKFFQHSQKLLAMQRDIKAEMQASRADPGGAGATVLLRMGVIESVLHSWLVDWIRLMRQNNPQLELELSVETTPVLVDHIRRGAVDLVFCALPTSGEGLRSQPLPSMPMVFVGHAETHTQDHYSLEDLSRLELLTFQRGSQPHAALMDVCKQFEAGAWRVHNISSISAMVQLVESGFGVATLPQATAQKWAQHLPLRCLPCDVCLPPLPVHVSYREDPTSGVAKEVMQSVTAFIKSRVNADGEI